MLICFWGIEHEQTLEILVHRSGYRPGYEQFASHARHRYRIVAKTSATPGPVFEPTLWVVHYSQAEPQNRIPANRIPLQADVNRMMQERRWLESQGQLARKEFMLNDRYNWPTVNLPGHAPPQGNFAHGQAMSNNMHMGMTSRHGQFYPSNQTAQLGPSPAKRQRQGMAQPMLGGGGGVLGVPTGVPLSQESLLEEEENTALGDLLDNLTQEEISKVRYVQHHMWMEEILSSPYATGTIEPTDLGLGLVGELARLTDGIIAPPVNGKTDDLTKGGHSSADRQHENYHRLGKGQMEEFERRVGKFLEDGEKDLRRMKAAHARRLSDMRRTKAYTVSERRLSKVVSAQVGEEQSAKLNIDKMGDEATARNSGLLGSEPDADDVLKGIVNDIENSMGVVIKPRKDIVCIDKGGFIDDRESENADTAMSENNQSTAQDILANSSGQTDDATAGANADTKADVGTDAGVAKIQDDGMDVFASGSAESAPVSDTLAASEPNPPSTVTPTPDGVLLPQTNTSSKDEGLRGSNLAVDQPAVADGMGDIDMMKDINFDINVDLPDIPDVSGAPVIGSGSGPSDGVQGAEKNPDEDWIMVNSANAEKGVSEQTQQQQATLTIAPSQPLPLSAVATSGVAIPTQASNGSPSKQTNDPPNADSTSQPEAQTGGNAATTLPLTPASHTPVQRSAITSTSGNHPAPVDPSQAATVPAASEPIASTGPNLYDFDGNMASTSVEGLVDFSGAVPGDGLNLDLDNSAFGDAFHLGESAGADGARDVAGDVAGKGIASIDDASTNVAAAPGSAVAPDIAAAAAAAAYETTVPVTVEAGGVKTPAPTTEAAEAKVSATDAAAAE